MLKSIKKSATKVTKTKKLAKGSALKKKPKLVAKKPIKNSALKSKTLPVKKIKKTSITPKFNLKKGKKSMPLPTVDIKWTENYKTAQIYSNGVELALCSDNNEQIGPFVFCKDFFQDAIVADIHDIQCSIYSYQYNKKTCPATPTKNTKVLIADSGDAAFKEKVANIPDFINQIEKAMGLELSTLHECNNPPETYKKCGIYLITGDKIWTHAPPVLSLWTLLVRNGIRHKIGDKWETTVEKLISGAAKPAQKHDKTYITHAKPGLDLIVQKGILKLFGQDRNKNYPKNKAGHTMHHYSGAVSYGSGKAKSNFPDWEYPTTTSEPPSCCFS